MATFRQEIQELVDEITGDAHPEESLAARAHHIARELFDVVGKVVNLDDDPAAIAEAKAELSDAAALVAGKLLADRPLIRMVVMSGLPSAIDPAVDLIVQYTGTAEQFVDEHIVPRLTEWEATVHRIRVSLEG